MSGLPLRSWVAWTCLALGCLGCGRLGFDGVPLEGTSPHSETVRDGDGGDRDAAPRPIPGSDGATPLPSSDAAAQAVDAALPEPDLLPLPNPIVCSSLTGVVACDNFSGSASGALVATSRQGAGARTTTDGLFHGSTKAEMEAAALVAVFNPVSSGDLFLRFSAFVPSHLPIAGINLASLRSAPNFEFELNLVTDGRVELAASGNGASKTATSGYTLPRDRWLCVLLQLSAIRDLRSSLRVLIDNTNILSVSPDTRSAGGVTAARAGINATLLGQGPAVVYVDNFLLTRDPPGDCP